MHALSIATVLLSRLVSAASEYDFDTFLDNSGDVPSAFQAAQVACARTLPGRKTSGCTLKLTCGRDYALSRTVDICIPLRLVGCGTGGWGAGSTFTAPQSPQRMTALRTRPEGTCPFPLPQGIDKASGQLYLEHLGILATGAPPDVADEPSYGLLAETRVSMEDVWIRGFTIGLSISADVNREPPTNANAWRLRDVQIDHAEHAGLWVQGGDTNAGNAELVRVSSSCERAGKWNLRYAPAQCLADPGDPECAPDLACAGILARPFIGARFASCSGSSNKETATGFRYPGMVFRGAGANLIESPYVESWSNPLDAQPWVNSGGQVLAPQGGRWRGPGVVFAGARLSSLIVANDRDLANRTETRFGAAASSGTFFEAAPIGQASMTQPLRLKSEPARGAFRWDVANLNSAVAERIGGTAVVGWGRRIIDVGTELRGPNPSVVVSYGPGPPPALVSGWPAGSVWIRTTGTASVGGIHEWVLTAGGWRPVARVQ